MNEHEPNERNINGREKKPTTAAVSGVWFRRIYDGPRTVARTSPTETFQIKTL